MKEDNKKRILFCIDAFNGGGAERILLEILSNIDRNNYDVDLIVIRSLGQLTEKFDKLGHYKTVLPKYYGMKRNNIILRAYNYLIDTVWKTIVFRYPNLVISKKYDYVIAYLESEATLFCSNVRLKKKGKKYAWIHCDVEKAEQWLNQYYSSHEMQFEVYQKYDSIFCVSQSVKDSFIKRFIGIDNEKVKVLYNPVDDGKIKRLATEKLDFTWSHDLKLIAIGRLNPQKNTNRALLVMDELRRIGIDAELVVLGEGNERDELESYICKHHLNNNVHLLGFKENPYPYLASADIYLCTSDYEGFSTTATEALIIGKPIVTTPCAGMGEIISDTQCGKIASFVPSELAKAIVMVSKNLEDYSERAKLRGECFSLAKRMDDFQSIF